jgi:serine/threonine protein kinase
VNILITDRCHVQLCDFGLVVVGDITDGCMTTTAQGLGTGIWMSPERLLPDKHRRTKADDVYAFACLCYYVSGPMYPTPSSAYASSIDVRGTSSLS